MVSRRWGVVASLVGPRLAALLPLIVLRARQGNRTLAPKGTTASKATPNTRQSTPNVFQNLGDLAMARRFHHGEIAARAAARGMLNGKATPPAIPIKPTTRS